VSRTLVPCALLFLNGNAAFFDLQGEQIPALQALGWCGLAQFVKRYPDAPVTVQGGDVDRELLPYLLRHLRDEPKETP
jgi:hypothetical protein